MKRKIIMFFSICILFIIVGGVYAVTGSASEQNPPDVQSVENRIQAYSISGGALVFRESMDTEDAGIVDVYEDDTYEYCIQRKDDALRSISMKDELRDGLPDEGFEDQAISQEKAGQLLDSALTEYFPEYHPEYLQIEDVSTHTSSGHYYKYEIQEVVAKTLCNKAAIYFSYDGKIVFLMGSHNDSSVMPLADSMDEKEAVERIFNHLKEEKAQQESEAAAQSENGEKASAMEDEAIIATEDMVLPDGVSVGEAFVPEHTMPECELYLDNMEDMEIISAVKDASSGKILWEIECQVKSNWGDYDSIFNPQGFFTIDAETGEILSEDWTDGE